MCGMTIVMVHPYEDKRCSTHIFTARNNNYKWAPGCLTHATWFIGFNTETLTTETKIQQGGGLRA